MCALPGVSSVLIELHARAAILLEFWWGLGATYIHKLVLVPDVLDVLVNVTLEELVPGLVVDVDQVGIFGRIQVLFHLHVLDEVVRATCDKLRLSYVLGSL